MLEVKSRERLQVLVMTDLRYDCSRRLRWDEEQKHWEGASLVAQWLRICLPVQGTRVRALVWEDPTCRGATRPMSHNC